MLSISVRQRILLSRSIARCSTAAQAATTSPASAPEPDRPPRYPKNQGFSPQNVYSAINIVKKQARARFVETIEVAVKLNVDPRKQTQNVKGIASLPRGLGKQIRVGAFCVGNDIELAKNAGADVAGAEDLIKEVQGGSIPFDRVVATPDIMTKLSRIGKILGPRGLMPNPKLGTVTTDIAKAVKSAKAGSITFRVDRHGIIHCGVAKVDFSTDYVADNIRSLMLAISDAKPEGLKGKYIKGMHITSTMGRSIPVDLTTVDPSNPKFMLDEEEVKKLGY